MQANQIDALLEEQEKLFHQSQEKKEDTKTTESSPRHERGRGELDRRGQTHRSRDSNVSDARPGSDRESFNGNSRRRSRSPRAGGRRYNDRGYRRRSRSASPPRHVRSGRRGADEYRRDDRRLERHDDYRHGDRRDDGHRGGQYRNSRRSPNARSRRSPRPRSPRPSSEERDKRTVFVQQLAGRLRNKDLKRFFESVGKVVEATIVCDRVSARSKGVGYVEFREEASVQAAMSLTGQKLMNVPIIVSFTEAEKNRQARAKESNVTRNNSAPQTRLYVGNIQFSLTENDLTEVFQPWGELANVFLQKDENGRSRGYAFVEFVKPEAAKHALEHMNNFVLGDRAIRVGLGGDRNSQFPEADKPATARDGNLQGSAFSGMGGRGTHAGGNDRSGGRDADRVGGASALDDVDGESIKLNSHSRDLLMRKLARTDEPAQAVAPPTETRSADIDEPTPTRCIVLKDCYGRADMLEPNWKPDLEADIRWECNQKYGKVVHIAVAPENGQGEVYVKFVEVAAGEKCFKSLQGRFYNGHRVTALYVVDVVYNSLFPRAAAV